MTESEQCLDEVRLVSDDGWFQQPGGLRPGGAPAELPGGYRNVAQGKFEQPENMIDPHIEEGHVRTRRVRADLGCAVPTARLPAAHGLDRCRAQQ
ncbi:MAG: hypothetical protein ACJ76X_10990 [Solirubrobacteraceae bacterium]